MVEAIKRVLIEKREAISTISPFTGHESASTKIAGLAFL
jgi:hypothetical protein